MKFWESIRDIFRREEAAYIEDQIRDDPLLYIGDEPECFACALPIHGSHKSRRLEGQGVHIYCFKKLKRIAKGGMNLNEF